MSSIFPSLGYQLGIGAVGSFIAKNVANWWEVRGTEEYEELGEIV